MTTQENQLDYPFADFLPEPGKKFQVAPGVFWIRMPLPFQLNHINLWLLRDRFEGRDGWTAIDCGIGNDETRKLWSRLISKELEGLPIVRVICTHMHPDHLGNAAWLSDQFNCRVWMTLGEYTMGRVVQAGLEGLRGESTVQHMVTHGFAEKEHVDQLKQRGNHFAKMVPEIPFSFRRIVDAERVMINDKAWRVITGFGHSPEHASLYAEEQHVLIAGDMLLPRISTNIGVHVTEPEANPLQQFLSSIDRLSFLAAPGSMVLPSHGRPFQKLQVRVQQLHQHHDDRLNEVRELCVNPTTAADVIPVMFKRKLDTQQMYFAFGEALAHLHYLWYAGDVKRERGPDNVYRFKRAS